MRTRVYREQHRLLLALLAEFPKSPDAVEERMLRPSLVRFAGVVRAHLRLEDEYLYPILFRHEDQRIASAARRLADAWGSLAASFDALYERWMEPGTLADAPGTFLEEWKAFASTLRRRIEEEERELYDLLDRSG